MLVRLLRNIIGFALACIGTGVTLVLFVHTPSELASLAPEVMRDQVMRDLELAFYVATQAALFAAPFALVAAGLGEALRNRDWTYYALAGLIMAGLAFFAQHSTEQAGQPTIVNNYALTAFLTAGLVGGTLFWLLSGRLAGGRELEPVPARPDGGKAVVTAASVSTPPRAAGSSPAASKPDAARPAPAAAKPDAVPAPAAAKAESKPASAAGKPAEPSASPSATPPPAAKT
ncbi:MAG: hypothetical protein AB7O57_01435 [Hyphomicrobiaceae bacterium]